MAPTLAVARRAVVRPALAVAGSVGCGLCRHATCAGTRPAPAGPAAWHAADTGVAGEQTVEFKLRQTTTNCSLQTVEIWLMKYLCLAYEEEAKLNALSRTEWDALRRETLDYVETLRSNGHLIHAEPLQSVRTAVSVRVRHQRLAATDGPFAETKEQLGGFFLVDARDLNEAIQIASKWPSARLGTIEVRPVATELPEDARYA